MLPAVTTAQATGKTEMDQHEWRCRGCGKLLGVVRGGRMHLRFARGHEYFVGFPVAGTCRRCGALNECAAQMTDAPDGGGRR